MMASKVKPIYHKPYVYKSESIKIISEQLKSKNVPDDNQQKTFLNSVKSKLGDPHPFDYTIVEDLRKKFGLVDAVIKKYSDFTIGPGYYIDTEDEQIDDTIEEWVAKTKFNKYLRPWFEGALTKGTEFLEIAGLSSSEKENTIKVANSSTIYVNRDEVGNVQGFNQYIGTMTGIIKAGDITPLDKNTIIQLDINSIGNSAYGYGIIYSALNTIDKFLMAESSIHKLTQRKANVPIHAKLGSIEKDDWPDQGDIDAFASNLQYMNDMTEWATGPNVEFKVIDFGNIGEKFDTILDNDYKLLSYSFQVPEVLLGAGNVAEGLAKVQMDGFNRRVKSLQGELSNVMTIIFDKVLGNAGISNPQYKICWNELNNDERNAELTVLQTMLMTTSPGMKKELEKKIAALLEIDYDDIENNQAEFDQQLQLQHQKQAMKPKMKGESLLMEKFDTRYDISGLKDVHETNITENIKVNEWLNKDITNYKDKIIETIELDKFIPLLAKNQTERRNGYLTKSETNKIRKVFLEAIKNNLGVMDIKQKISESVKVPDLKEKGNVILTSEQRLDMIAKTELTRLLNKGLVSAYEDNGDILIRWDATIDESTCPTCASLDGQTFFGDAMTQDMVPPIHPNCRCSLDEITGSENISLVKKLKGKLKDRLAPQELEILDGKS